MSDRLTECLSNSDVDGLIEIALGDDSYNKSALVNAFQLFLTDAKISKLTERQQWLCRIILIRDSKHRTDQGKRDSATMLSELRVVAQTISSGIFASDPQVMAALAEAFAEHGDYDEAITHYEYAERLSNGRCSSRILNQLSNLRARRAERMIDSVAAERELCKEIEILERRAATEVSRDLYTITASAWKLLLMVMMRPDYVGVDEAQVDALRKMALWYHKADELANGRDPYAALNALSVYIFNVYKEQSDSKIIEPIYKGLQEAASEGSRLYSTCASFWNGVHEIDADLYRLLLDSKVHALTHKQIDDRLKEIVRRYRELAARSSLRNMDSVAKQIRFIGRWLPESAGYIKKALSELGGRFM